MIVNKQVIVALDAMGGDFAPLEQVKGAVEAVNEYDNIKVILTAIFKPTNRCR